MSLLFALVLVYYKPFPPQLHLNIPEVYTHSYTFNDINTTFLLKFNNPNHRINLDLHNVVANLQFGYDSHTSKDLSPISLQVNEDKFLKFIFLKKVELKPEIDSVVKRYFFSMTISVKLKVHLGQLPLTFPYNAVIKCYIIVDDYSPARSVEYSSCKYE